MVTIRLLVDTIRIKFSRRLPTFYPHSSLHPPTVLDGRPQFPSPCWHRRQPEGEPWPRHHSQGRRWSRQGRSTRTDRHGWSLPSYWWRTSGRKACRHSPPSAPWSHELSTNHQTVYNIAIRKEIWKLTGTQKHVQSSLCSEEPRGTVCPPSLGRNTWLRRGLSSHRHWSS